MRVAVITGFLREDWHSAELCRALGLGAEAVAVDPAELVVECGVGWARVVLRGEPAEAFDAFVLARGLSRRGQAELQLLAYRLLSEGGALVVNEVGALLAAQDKVRTSALLARTGVPTPPAVAAQDLAGALAALSRLGAAVKKPPWGSLGEGIELLRPGAAARRALQTALHEDAMVYLQAYVPSGEESDLRAFVVGGRVAAAVRRQARGGRFGANLARGGRATAVDLPREHAEAAVRAARALGLEYAGVDLVSDPRGRPLVLEVNGNPSWRGLMRATGRDMAEAIAARVFELARRRRVARRARMS